MPNLSSNDTSMVLNPWQSLLAGLAAGVTQSIVSLPLWTLKLRKQCQLPWTLNPRVLYKGLFPATFAITFMSIAEICCTTMIHGWLRQKASNHNESSFERIHAALIGGTVATIVSNPISVVITQQHKLNHAFFIKTLFSLVETKGYNSLYVSFAFNWAINSAFTVSFYALYPLIHQAVLDSEYQDGVATLAASTCLGLVMSTLVQPLDTLKTAQEYHANEPHQSLLRQLRNAYRHTNMRALYRGFLPATASTISAVAASSIALQQTETYFLNQHTLS